MYRIRRFGVIKTATVVAIMYMVIVGVFVAPFAVLGLLIAPSSGGVSTAAGIVTIGVVAIFGYGLAGWVITAVTLAVYNLAARWVGGIVVEIEQVVPPTPPPDWMLTSTGATPPTPPPSTPPAAG